VSTHAIGEAAGLCPREVRRGFRILAQHVTYFEGDERIQTLNYLSFF